METESWKYKENSTLNHHLLPAIGGMHVKDLKQVHLQCIISNLATKGYATGTMKKIKQTAERVMRVAVDSDLIVKNHFTGIKIPYVEPEARRALTEFEIKLITHNWRGTKMGPAAMIMLYAGLRIGPYHCPYAATYVCYNAV